MFELEYRGKAKNVKKYGHPWVMCNLVLADKVE